MALTQREFDFDAGGQWARLPTSKVRRPPSSAPFAWTYSYTAFSLDFATQALKLMGAGPGTAVFDPFAGSGTTLAAAASLGAAAHGSDINPFSILMNRVRMSSDIDEQLVQKLLDPKRAPKTRPSTSKFFNDDDWSYLQLVLKRIQRRVSGGRLNLWSAVINDPTKDAEAVALLAMAIAARTTALVSRGSNPVWYRASTKSEVQAAAERFPFGGVASGWGKRIATDLSKFAPDHPNDYSLRTAGADELVPISYDFCLTSPPYLTRLDYVVAHTAELAVLSEATSVDIDTLKSRMIGTTKITRKDWVDIPKEWGQLCQLTLDQIARHPSYASMTYYFPVTASYFSGLYKSLQRAVEGLKFGGKILVVLQDSFYKEVKVPTPEIAVEMLLNLGCQATIVKSTVVNSHMGRMDPKQARRVPEKRLSEAAVLGVKQA